MLLLGLVSTSQALSHQSAGFLQVDLGNEEVAASDKATKQSVEEA
jgi:colicin import membrane protein